MARPNHPDVLLYPIKKGSQNWFDAFESWKMTSLNITLAYQKIFFNSLDAYD